MTISLIIILSAVTLAFTQAVGVVYQPIPVHAVHPNNGGV